MSDMPRHAVAPSVPHHALDPAAWEGDFHLRLYGENGMADVVYVGMHAPSWTLGNVETRVIVAVSSFDWRMRNRMLNVAGCHDAS